MPRPLRPPDPDGTYHVTARGVDRCAVVRDDADRAQFARRLAEQVGRRAWIVYAWCLLDNHYHLLVRTPAGDLSAGIQRLNGTYAQAFNRRHERTGHLWQGRFHGVRVHGDAQLLATVRYVTRNPVAAGLVVDVDAWPWGSHAGLIGTDAAIGSPDAMLDLLSEDERVARRAYRALVAA